MKKLADRTLRELWFNARYAAASWLAGNDCFIINANMFDLEKAALNFRYRQARALAKAREVPPTKGNNGGSPRTK